MRKRMIAILTVAALAVSLFSTPVCAAAEQTSGVTAEAVYGEADEETAAEKETDGVHEEDESVAVTEDAESAVEDLSGDTTEEASDDIEVESADTTTKYVPKEELTVGNETSPESSDMEESEDEQSDAEALITASSATVSGSCGTSATWVLSSDGTLTISGSGAMTDYSDFSSVPWYSYRSSISAIVVSSGITRIGDFSFVYCPAETVSLPSGLLSIGEAAFYGCTSLKSVVIPKTVTKIDIAAFAVCTALSSVTLGSSLSTIENYTFQDCTNLKSLSLPSNVTYVAAYAFTGCDDLKVSSSTLTKMDDGSYQVVATVKLTGTYNYTYAYQVLKLVNKERKAAGLSTLKMDEDLLAAAMQRAAECNIYFSHTRPSGLSCFTVSSKASGENIAAGQSTASSVMDSWMSSSGHKANILGSDYQSIGIGCFTQGGVTYWVQLFGTDSATTLTQPDDTSKTVTVQLDPDIFEDCLYLYASTTSLKTGKSTTLKARVTNPGWSYVYAELKGSSLSWSSGSTSIASVSSGGKVTGQGVGTAKITAKTKRGGLSASVKIKSSLATPSISKVSNTSSGIKVKWGQVTGASGYYVYRKTGASGSYKKIATIKSGSTLSYTNKTSGSYKVSTGKTYYYKIVAYSGSSTSSKSSAAMTVRLTPASLSSVKNTSSKTMTVQWSKKSGVTGYQVQYAANSDFSSGKATKTCSGASTVKKVISGLTKGKTYYVRIRTYKTVDGTKYYSAWSSSKKVKITK